jgi:quinol monooxygenase YgiN
MNTKPITVVATFHARPGKEAELRAGLIGLIATTRKEAGCLNYDLHVSPSDPAQFLFHETWTSKALLDAHLAAPHVQALLPRVNDLCTGFPEIKIWDRIS